MPRTPVTAFAAAALVAVVVSGSTSFAAQSDTEFNASAATALAPLYQGGGSSVAGSYVVMLKEGSPGGPAEVSASAQTARRAGGDVATEFPNLGAYRATLTADQLTQVRQDPRVSFVQPETVLRRIDATPRAVDAVDAQPAPRSGTQPNPPSWGLDRIDQAKLPLDRSFTPGGTGAGVHAFVIDSGINESHVDYKERLGESIDLTKTGSVRDCFGHGAHIAGTIAGTNYGIAKQATIHTAKIFDCDGGTPAGDMFAALDWVMGKKQLRPGVVNLSLITEADRATDEAVQRAINSGLIVVVAAGNYSTDACTMSPSRLPDAITVGNVDSRDRRAPSSNYGTCVDLFAPGELIRAPYINSSTEITELSGTSMSTPHVVGAAALFLQKNPRATQAQVAAALVSTATRDTLTNVGSGSKNLLLNVTGLGAGAGGPAPIPTPTTPTPTTPAPTTPAPTTPAPTTPAPTTSAPDGANEFSNNTPMALNDYQAVTSSITSTRSGASKVTVTIDINHPCLQQLEIAITTPDGTRNVVKRSTFANGNRCQAWSGPKNETYTMRSETQGQWTIQVTDNQAQQTGTLNGWKVSFS